MPNWVTVTITVAGESDGKERFKEGFKAATSDPNQTTPPVDVAVMPPVWIWRLSDEDGQYLLDVRFVEEDGRLVITGDAKWEPPLVGLQSLSSRYPSLTFEISGFELTNYYWQRWKFEGGNGWLLDCIEEIYDTTDGYVIPIGEGFDEAEDLDEDPSIVYMRDGEQYLRLPDWVSVADKEVPPKNID